MLRTFVQNLKTRRDAAGLTQEKLAEAAGISKNAVTTLEGGTRSPNLKSLIRVAGALGCEPWELLLPAVNRPTNEDRAKAAAHADQKRERPAMGQRGAGREADAKAAAPVEKQGEFIHLGEGPNVPTFADVMSLLISFGKAEPEARAVAVALLRRSIADTVQSQSEDPGVGS